MKAILVGESNPYGADPRFALYPAPDGCSGHRLCCRVLGMHRADYLKVFDRVNLCAGPWNQFRAGVAAEEILAGRGGARLVLMGSKVAGAFGLRFYPFRTTQLPHLWTDQEVLVLPHPSGRNRLWEQEGAIGRARDAVAAFLPDVAPLLGLAPV